MELEAESKAQRTWTPVLQVPEETVAVATFQWKRVPLTRGVILRLGAIAAAIVFACGILAFAASAMLPKTYGARSEIVYPLGTANPSGDTLRTDRVLATQLVAIKSRQVLTPVAVKFHMTADDLSKKIVASVLADSEVIRIEADDASQAKALAIVTAVSKAYLTNTALTDPNVAVAGLLQSRINGLDGQRDAKTRELTGLTSAREASLNPNTPSVAELQAQSELDGLNNQINGLQTQLDAATIAEKSGQKVQQLTVPYAAGKVAPKPMRAGIAGVLAGMMIAAGVVVLLLRRRLRDIPADQFG